MDVLTRLGFFACSLLLITGCQIPYLANSAWQQAKLFSRRVPLEKVLSDPKTDASIKNKILIVQAAHAFAEEDLGLEHTGNYTQFVALDRPYVSYIVHAAPVFELESYRWWFPIVGHVPYKGYFSKEGAEQEARAFDPEKYDTFIRGVTAYSTLGWFNDPILSSMMRYSDHELVNVVIHETVHATIFIKGEADFNERMATFLGDWGTELYYLKAEGQSSPTLALIHNEREDQKLFSQFITQEITQMRNWYAAVKEQKPFAEKAERMEAIRQRFREQLKAKLKTDLFAAFADAPLNNARLLAIGTYYEDLGDFEKLRAKIGDDFKAILAYLKNLSKSERPQIDLKAFLTGV